MIFHDEELNDNDFFKALEKLLDSKDVELMRLEYQNGWKITYKTWNLYQKILDTKLLS